MCNLGVDDLFEAKGRWWCHLIGDDFSPSGLAVRHEFASRLGLSQRAFHNPEGQPRPHYDLTPPYRQRALELGAHPLTRQQLVAYLQLGRERLESGKT